MAAAPKTEHSARPDNPSLSIRQRSISVNSGAARRSGDARAGGQSPLENSDMLSFPLSRLTAEPIVAARPSTKRTSGEDKVSFAPGGLVGDVQVSMRPVTRAFGSTPFKVSPARLLHHTIIFDPIDTSGRLVPPRPQNRSQRSPQLKGEKVKIALTANDVRQIYDKTSSYYNTLHTWGTFGGDEKGRNLLIEGTVREDDCVLDAGGGTGLTAIKAAKKVKKNGKVVILDLSEGMLEQARKKIDRSEAIDNIELKLGDMYQIPYPDETFDSILSAYSTCPLDDPLNAVREMLRALKAGGLLGIAHSTDPGGKIAKWISSSLENILWRFPRLSLGCRNISLANDIGKLDVDIISERTIGAVPFFFKILILKKP